MIGPLSYLDIVLIAVAFLSGMLALYRGLTRELLSILSWIIAGAAVLYFVLYQKAFAEEIANNLGAPVQIAQIGVGALIFLIVLVVVHLITSRISDSILESRVGLIDRLLGFAFGVLRGFILIVIPFLFFEKLYPTPEAQPTWISQSMSLPMLRSTGSAIEGFLVQVVPADLSLPDQDQPS